MTLFVDASALIAIIADEPEGKIFTVAIREDRNPLSSAMSCWETVLSLERSYGCTIERARREIEAIALAASFTLVSIGPSELELALDAYQTYGKGRHPAKLNMGDCFAYACAKAHRAALLYKGDDFAQTDLA